MSTTTTNILNAATMPRLNDTNYTSWSSRMRALLNHEIMPSPSLHEYIAAYILHIIIRAIFQPGRPNTSFCIYFAILFTQKNIYVLIW